MFRGSSVAVLAATALLWSFGAGTASASPIVFNNGAPTANLDAANGVDILYIPAHVADPQDPFDFDTPAQDGRAYDDFVVAKDTYIDGVGFYFQNYYGIDGWNHDIQYAFFDDNGGVPGTMLDSGAGQNVAAVDSGAPWWCCGDSYLVTFDLMNPFTAMGGARYWLQLGGAGSNRAQGDQYSWWITTDDNGSPTMYPGFYLGPPFDDTSIQTVYATENQLAFDLTGTPVPQEQGPEPVPEPASITLVGLGLALGAREWRKRQAVQAR